MCLITSLLTCVVSHVQFEVVLTGEVFVADGAGVEVRRAVHGSRLRPWQLQQLLHRCLGRPARYTVSSHVN